MGIIQHRGYFVVSHKYIPTQSEKRTTRRWWSLDARTPDTASSMLHFSWEYGCHAPSSKTTPRKSHHDRLIFLFYVKTKRTNTMFMSSDVIRVAFGVILLSVSVTVAHDSPPVYFTGLKRPNQRRTPNVVSYDTEMTQEQKRNLHYQLCHPHCPRVLIGAMFWAQIFLLCETSCRNWACGSCLQPRWLRFMLGLWYVRTSWISIVQTWYDNMHLVCSCPILLRSRV